ncbi:hypothetical protein CB1_000568072 [Camelus ferus]|nr:hypothetical protein CB1_000568072 [Camelus ferus]
MAMRTPFGSALDPYESPTEVKVVASEAQTQCCHFSGGGRLGVRFSLRTRCARQLRLRAALARVLTHGSGSADAHLALAREEDQQLPEHSAREPGSEGAQSGEAARRGGHAGRPRKPRQALQLRDKAGLGPVAAVQRSVEDTGLQVLATLSEGPPEPGHLQCKSAQQKSSTEPAGPIVPAGGARRQVFLEIGLRPFFCLRGPLWLQGRRNATPQPGRPLPLRWGLGVQSRNDQPTQPPAPDAAAYADVEGRPALKGSSSSSCPLPGAGDVAPSQFRGAEKSAGSQSLPFKPDTAVMGACRSVGVLFRMMGPKSRKAVWLARGHGMAPGSPWLQTARPGALHLLVPGGSSCLTCVSSSARDLGGVAL